MRFLGLGALAAVMLSAASADAAQLIAKSALVPKTAGQYSTTLNVDQFDPTLGTLNSIVVLLYTTYDASASTTFDAQADKLVHSAIFNIHSELTDQSGDIDLVQDYGKSTSARGCGFDCHFGPGDSNIQKISVADDGTLLKMTRLSAITQFVPYIGLGQIAFGFDARSSYESDGYALVGGQAQIVYNYTAVVPPVSTDPTSPVPEPASWALMLAGFGFVGATMRRRPRVGIALA